MSAAQAREALDTVERGRRAVVGEIAVPGWYWWGLAAGWVGLGVVTDAGHPWLGAVATLVVGAGHAAVAPRALTGRHGSPHLRVRAEVAGRQTRRLVLPALVLLVGLTVLAAVAADAAGAARPATVASLLVAVLLVLGGPRLLGLVRRRVLRGAAS